MGRHDRLIEMDLRERIAAGEGQRLEFKRELGHPKELASDLVCFANAEGGEILIGVEDTGAIVGVRDSETVQRTIQEVAKNNVENPIRGIDTQVVQTGDGDVVIVQIPRSADRPHATSDGVVKIRRGNTCQRVTRADLVAIAQSSGAQAMLWDERIVPGTTIADLNLARVEEVLRREASTVASDGGAYVRARQLLLAEGVTIAGLLCYGRAVQDRLPYAVIVAVRHRGLVPSSQLTSHLEVRGRLDEQFAAAAEFVRTQLPAPRDFTAPGDEERGLPAEALRHALINALVHRDYDIPAPIRLHVFDDRVEIMSPGQLLNSLTLEAVRSGAIHLPRNPRTYWELFRMGLVTWTGQGMTRMRDAMAERGLPEPEVRLVAAEVHVVLRLSPPANP